MPGYHSRRERRQARHIITSERRRGVSKRAATRIGWATVNKQRRRRK